MRKAVIAYSKNKDADKLCGYQLISAFIFQFKYGSNPLLAKFEFSSL